MRFINHLPSQKLYSRQESEITALTFSCYKSWLYMNIVRLFRQTFITNVDTLLIVKVQCKTFFPTENGWSVGNKSGNVMPLASTPLVTYE